MKIIRKRIPISQIKTMAEKSFGNLVKAVVDTEKEIMVLDGELHADEEALLLEQGSKQTNLWGINLYPDLGTKDWIEFDSMINLRPANGNRSRSVDDVKTRKKIISLVNQLIDR